MATAQFGRHTHAIMFHHFHDENHPVGQGSISAANFGDMIDWLSERYHLLNADEYFYKFKNNLLDSDDICLTFDDALLCQSAIAAPILKSRNIRAYFFVYSSPFSGTPDFLEIYRHFRNTQFKSIDEFYNHFFRQAAALIGPQYDVALSKYDKNSYLAAFLFYTENDKWFRFLRDEILGKQLYDEVMQLLMTERGFDPTGVMAKLWMNEQNLRDLQADGHTIGLHSYSHPTALHNLDIESQRNEYAKNFHHLSEVLRTPIKSMSHPCGNYNSDTLLVLNQMGIEIGFRSNNSVKTIRSNLEIPREDHANILTAMRQ